MQITMIGDVLQASRYDMKDDDGQQIKGCNIIVSNQAWEPNPNRAGLELMKMSAPYELFDQVQNVLPCECDIKAEPIQGSGGKAAFKIISITPKNKQQKPAA